MSARQGSREEDNKGNDIVNPINIRFQCKKKLSKDGRLDITPLFVLPKEDYFTDILFIKSTKKNKTKESPLGTYAVMDLNTFYILSNGEYACLEVDKYTTKAGKVNIPFDFADKDFAYQFKLIKTKVHHKMVVVLSIDFFYFIFGLYLNNHVYTR